SRHGLLHLNRLGTTFSSISMATTPAASISCTVRLTLTALPKPSSASTMRLTSAIRVMRRQWSTTSDMLDSTISGTPRFDALPTEPDSTHTSYPSMSAIRAERGSKIFAARTHVGPEMTLRNRSRARDIGVSPLGGVAQAEIDENNILEIKGIGVAISTFETLPFIHGHTRLGVSSRETLYNPPC